MEKLRRHVKKASLGIEKGSPDNVSKTQSVNSCTLTPNLTPRRAPLILPVEGSAIRRQTNCRDHRGAS